MKQFEERGAQLLGLSCDSVPALKTWAQSLGGIGYPLLSDFHPHGKFSQDLGIFNAEGGYPARSITIVGTTAAPSRMVNSRVPGLRPGLRSDTGTPAAFIRA